ncbi:hypothetical protein NC653_020497 [Populus alba x Populus x berolinensis]|uniref:Uncharacterized protein n=1 Tax=Populus alba x Populus x berolinensis TaxID=444605 RepID=A0AAD6MKJ9_9ROSI|nr:hypothetical protein NC653_020497 [Populus alba x Populus x berolinensis]
MTRGQYPAKVFGRRSQLRDHSIIPSRLQKSIASPSVIAEERLRGAGDNLDSTETSPALH